MRRTQVIPGQRLQKRPTLRAFPSTKRNHPAPAAVPEWGHARPPIEIVQFEQQFTLCVASSYR